LQSSRKRNDPGAFNRPRGEKDLTGLDRKRIGIIADSHGNLEATAETIRLLKGRGADLLVHLGDFCDSIRHDRAAAMIDLLLEHDVLAVKGNNDFLVEKMLADERRRPDAEGAKMLAFLRDAPLVRTRDDIRFAHSLPFDTLRAFYEPIDTGDTRRAEALFNEADFRILFCGHSHLPILFRKENGCVTREPVPPGLPVILKRTGRYIFIVGAATDGECALFDPATGLYERIRVEKGDNRGMGQRLAQSSSGPAYRPA
jgi:putative phosphoesterase